MNIFHAISLAVIQGLTEFLPVSSSGHLVLLQNLFGLKEPEILFDICLHVGTLFAICVVFFNDIRSIILSAFRFPSLLFSAGWNKNILAENADIKMLIMIAVGTIPTGIIGLLFHKISGQIFASVSLVGAMLFITGTLLWASRWAKPEGRKIGQFKIKDALIIGLIQGIAVLPGISRSGSTIVMGLLIGVERETAARYSFLLSIPAIIGALILELNGLDVHMTVSAGSLLISVVIASIVGFIALKVLLSMVKHGRLYFFAFYCWLLGAVALIWA